MSEKDPSPGNDPAAPYGTQPRRGAMPLMLWCVIYAAWFVVLVVLARTAQVQ